MKKRLVLTVAILATFAASVWIAQSSNKEPNVSNQNGKKVHDVPVTVTLVFPK